MQGPDVLFEIAKRLRSALEGGGQVLHVEMPMEAFAALHAMADGAGESEWDSQLIAMLGHHSGIQVVVKVVESDGIRVVAR